MLLGPYYLRLRFLLPAIFSNCAPCQLGVPITDARPCGPSSPRRTCGRSYRKRGKLDPFSADHSIEDGEGYERLLKLSPAKLDALIDVLVVELLTAHPVRPTPLVP